MTNFRDTDEAAAFIATGASRETSHEVMRAIAFFARDLDEAEALWNGDAINHVATIGDVWENATGNGRIDDAELMWGGRSLAEIIAKVETQWRVTLAPKEESR